MIDPNSPGSHSFWGSKHTDLTTDRHGLAPSLVNVCASVAGAAGAGIRVGAKNKNPP